MEILFYRYNSICEPDLIAIFQKYGLSVVTIEAEITNKSLSGSERLNLLTKAIDSHTFSFVFSINFFPSISDLCEIYKLPYICWTVDSPVMELFHKAVRNRYTRVFVFDRAQYRTLSPYNPGNIFHLPLATNVERWDQVIRCASAKDRNTYAADISFVGSLYSEKDPYQKYLSVHELPDKAKGFVDGLIAAQSQIYGYNLMEVSLTDEIVALFKEKMAPLYLSEENSIMNTDRYVTAHQIIGMHAAYVERMQILRRLSESYPVDLYTQSDTSPLKDCANLKVRGSARTFTQMPLIFHHSRINLNITIRPIQTGLSLRIWDVLGCGGFLITNYQEELPDYFTPGEDLETFAGVEELHDKCGYYLSHEDARLKIARKGCEKVRSMHTYEKRIAELIRITYQSLQS